MAKEQLPLPGFENLPTVDLLKSTPQPNINECSPITPRELIYGNLNLNLRGRLYHWLEKVQTEGEFALDEILPEHYLKQISLYLYPQSPNNRWLNQSEVSAQVTGSPKSKDFRSALAWGLTRVWRRHSVGNRAVETLKPSHFLYLHLIRNKIQTIDELSQCTPEQIAKLTTNRNVFNELLIKMQQHFLDWNPQVIFPCELPPEDAFQYFQNLRNKT